MGKKKAVANATALLIGWGPQTVRQRHLPGKKPCQGVDLRPGHVYLDASGPLLVASAMQTHVFRHFVAGATFLLLAMPHVAGATDTARKPLRVFISADMEGVAGVVNGAQLAPGEFEYEKFRRLMTAEVNACIEGAFAAGATLVTVADSHGNGLSLLPEELNPRARLVRSWPRPLAMVEGIDKGYDALVLLGYHASIGTTGAVRAHTMSSKRIYGMRLNGVQASEALLSAAVAGHYGVPVVLVSGDDKTIDEARKTISDKITAQI